jgi:hypothetical protein
MSCPTCFNKKSQFSDVIQRHVQLTHSNHTYSFVKPNGSISFTMIFLCILVVVDRLLLLSIYKFNIIAMCCVTVIVLISYVLCDCDCPY